MEGPRVSVVTVVRNGEAHLEDAIQSVLSQDDEVEYVVIDGGSTDGTVDIIRRYADGLAFWVSEPDRGVYDAMNKGIRRSTGELVKLLNADDRLKPGSVSRALKAYDRDPGDVVIASEIDYVDEDGQFLKRLDRSYAFGPGPVLHPSWYVPRRLYDILGLYDTSFRVSADFDMYVRLLKAGVEFRYVDVPLVEFRSGGLSNVTYQGVPERFRITRRYYSTPTAVVALLKQATRKGRAQLLLSLLGEERTYRLRARVHRRRAASQERAQA
jgi:glycosyltransferase involved in cell wall biosynthesis